MSKINLIYISRYYTEVVKVYIKGVIYVAETFVDKFFVFPSFRGEANFELVIGLALTGSGDVGAVTLRTGE